MSKIDFSCPAETADFLKNPDRGYYSIYRFTVGNPAPGDYDVIITDEKDTLLLFELNLSRYAQEELTDDAVSSVDAIFRYMRGTGFRLIVRFLYDWEGRNLANEPRKIEIILGHMRALADVIRKNSDIIFVTQGLFTGNWGEMHGTRFSRGDHLKKLYSTYRSALGNDVIISVRTPAQWRCAVGFMPSGKPGKLTFRRTDFLPALYNDAMLSTVSDLGTYGESEEEREYELTFQNSLCRIVPNGGEAVGDTPYSAPETAVQILTRMHVSYLNREHDRVTLDKWKNAVVDKPDSIWNGTSYLDYIDEHLGYRYVICGVNAKSSVFSSILTISVTLKNVGFAPIYRETEAQLVISGKDGVKVIPFEGDVRELYGESPDEAAVLRTGINKKELSDGEYTVYFRLFVPSLNTNVLLGNEGNSVYGCEIGRISVG